MPEQQFDQDAYLKYLDQLTDAQLSSHFRAIDRAHEPVKWRLAMDALARRGIFELPKGETEKSLRKRKSFFTPAVKIAIAWAMCAAIAVGGFYLSTYIKNLFFDYRISYPKTATSADGAYLTFFLYHRTGRFGKNNYRVTTVKKYAFFIKNSKATPFLPPPINGDLLPGNGRLFLFAENGDEFAIKTISGMPSGKWTRLNNPTPEEIKNPNCYDYSYFFYKGRVLKRAIERDYYHDPKTNIVEGKCRARDSKEPIKIFVFDQATGKRANRDLEKGFSDFKENITSIFEHRGKLYVFFSEYSSRNGMNGVFYKTFDGNCWSAYKQLLTTIDNIGDVTHDNKNIFIVYRTEDDDTLVSYKLLQGKRSKTVDFGKDNSKSLSMMYGASVVAENGNLYLAYRETDSITPAVYKLGINGKKLVIEREKIVVNSLFESPYVFFGAYCLLLFFGILIGSRIARKGLAKEISIGSHTLRAPTLLRRFGALFIDWLIFYPAAIYLVYYLGEKEHFDKQGAFIFLAMVCALLLMFLYSFILEGMLGGQTLGKKLFKLRVVKDDLTRCTPGAAALRFLLRHADSLGAYIVGALAYVSTEKRQRLGDMAARTIVVMDEPGLPREKAKAPDRFIPPETKRPY